MKRLLFLMAIVGLLHSPASHAIGDSTGCAGLSWGTLIDVLAKGSPQDLERAIEENHRVEGHRFSNRSKPPGEIYYYAGCGVAGVDALLAKAVEEGNVDITKYLLAKGARPGRHLLEFCSKPSGRAGAAAEGRRETFKLAIVASGLASHPDVLRCQDNNVLKAYFAAGAQADPERFARTLSSTVWVSGPSLAAHERQEIERASVYLIEGGMLRNGLVIQELASLCVAPVATKRLGCKELASFASIDYAALALGNAYSLNQWLTACGRVYPRRLWEGPADCSSLRGVGSLQYGALEAALGHAASGRLAQYEVAMRDLGRTLVVDAKFAQYKSAVLLHLGRSAGLTCKNDAEDLLKSAVHLQRELDKQQKTKETIARTFELAYYYFDKKRYQEALPLFRELYLEHPTFLGVSGTAQFHADRAALLAATGDAKNAKKAKEDAAEIGSRVRRGEVLFQRVRYPERCPTNSGNG